MSNSEDLFKRAVDLMVSEGYQEAGYEYVIIDDCWMEWERDSQTKELVPDRKRFKNGIKALADYVSSAKFHINSIDFIESIVMLLFFQ